MATILRDLSYRYQWLYDGISQVAALAVGGEARFRQLAIADLPIAKDTPILDLCCGAGQSTRYLGALSDRVIGLDASPLALQRAKVQVPQAKYIEAFAEKIPLATGEVAIVHTSAALHEMQPQQRQDILTEVYRVLAPGGIFTLIDFHTPTNPLFWPGLAIFMWLFETETAWELLQTDLVAELQAVGFRDCQTQLYAGGTLQQIRAQK